MSATALAGIIGVGLHPSGALSALRARVVLLDLEDGIGEVRGSARLLVVVVLPGDRAAALVVSAGEI